MSHDYLGRTDQEVLDFATNLANTLNEGAGPEPYGVSIEAAAAYLVLRNDYATKLAASIGPATRGPARTLAKNEAKEALVTQTRKLSMQINNREATTDAQRQALGLTIRKAPSPIPAPTVAPKLHVVSVEGRVVNLRLREASTGKRRKPEGVYSATIMKFVGESMPAELDQWVLVGSDTRLDTSVSFPDSLAPGTKVWFTAFWLNRKAESGPMCVPVSTHLGFDVAVSGGQQAGDGDEDLRIAA